MYDLLEWCCVRTGPFDWCGPGCTNYTGVSTGSLDSGNPTGGAELREPSKGTERKPMSIHNATKKYQLVA